MHKNTLLNNTEKVLHFLMITVTAITSNWISKITHGLPTIT